MTTPEGRRAQNSSGHEEASVLPCGEQGTNLPVVIKTPSLGLLDLRGLPETERQQLVIDYAKGMINVQTKANELGVDAQNLRATLDTITEAAKKMADDGVSGHITKVHEDRTGKTEITMGTDLSSKIGASPDQGRRRDYTMVWIGILVFLVLALLLVVIVRR